MTWLLSIILFLVGGCFTSASADSKFNSAGTVSRHSTSPSDLPNHIPNKRFGDGFCADTAPGGRDLVRLCGMAMYGKSLGVSS